jgi:hypothetical protein
MQQEVAQSTGPFPSLLHTEPALSVPDAARRYRERGWGIVFLTPGEKTHGGRGLDTGPAAR